MDNLKGNNYLQILFILSILILGSALIIEYIFGYQPCNLCKIERIPYLLSIIILITNYLFKGNQTFYSTIIRNSIFIEKNDHEPTKMLSNENRSTCSTILVEVVRMVHMDAWSRVFCNGGLQWCLLNALLAYRRIPSSFLKSLWMAQNAQPSPQNQK